MAFPKSKPPRPSRKDPLPPAVILANVKLNHAVAAGKRVEYVPEFDDILYRLRLLMMNEDQIASYFGVTVRTIQLWRKAHASFARAHARGGDEADAEIIGALKHRALGYSHASEKVFMTKDGDIVRAETVEHYPPDTAAANLWLANRRRGQWSLRPEAGPPGGDAAGVEIRGGLPDE